MINNYKLLLLDISNYLKCKGWSKKSDTFYLSQNNNWGLINFQKSRENLSSNIKFTINLGVSSTLLRDFEEKDLKKKPSIDECHWRKRIGFLFPQKIDYWWNLTESSNIEFIISEIKGLIDKLVIPEMNNSISDSRLELIWLSGVSDGLTNLQRLAYLTVLLKAHNKDDSLILAIQELLSFAKKKHCEATARYHIKQLERFYAK